MTAEDPADEVSAAPPPARLVVALRWLMLASMGALVIAGVARAAAYREGRAALAGTAPVTAAARAAPAFVCPMHAAVTGAAAGSCPICGMALVARAAAPTEAAITTAAAASPAIEAPATVVAPERGLVQVTGRVSGWIATLAVAETGRRVERGQVLATIDSPELMRAQKTLLNARRWERNGQPNLEPSHEGDASGEMLTEARFRIEALGLDPRDVETIFAKGVQRTVPLRAPAGGVVIRKDAVVGAYVQPGTPLYTIADLSTVSVVGRVREEDAARVRVGQAATVRVRALPGETFAGKVVFVAPVLDGPGGNAEVRVDLPNANLRLRPGALAVLQVATRLSP